MGNFSHIDQREFLEGYLNFSVEVRPFIIKNLCEAHRYSIDKDEKEMIYLLTIEQFFLLLETFEGFFRATKDRKRIPLLESLNKDFNIQNLSNQLKGKDENSLLKELDIDVSKFSPNIQNEIKERFVKMATLFQKDHFWRTIKTLVPVYNALKHNMQLYKNKEGKIAFALDKKAENEINNIKGSQEKEHDISDDDISYLFDLALRMKSAIQDLIAVWLIRELE